MGLKSSHAALSAFILVSSLAGCGESSVVPDEDSGAIEDAFTVDDTASSPDASTVDASLVDGDGDGVLSDRDCDDTDATVGSSGSRACASSCNSGAEICTSGVWGACSASTDCSCPTPGATRIAPCGRCGMGSQTCGADNIWSAVGTCFSEGECAAGEVGVETLPMCAEHQRLCDATCHWLAWMDTRPPGECEVGAVQRTTDGCSTAGESHDRTCNTNCTWDAPTDPCSSGCVRPMPTSTSGGTPVCIPYGPFLLGGDGVITASPSHTVTLSEFYIDRYPVSHARYQMCVDAHACPAPTSTLYTGQTDTQWVRGVRLGSQQAFCVWDGGTLPTEFQWEKAARGPAPDARTQTWGSTAGDCNEHTMSMTCTAWPFDVDDSRFPGAVSPFGVRLMGTLPEATGSRLPTNWDWLTELTDPPDQDASAQPVYRGYAWFNGVGYFTTDDSALMRGANGTSLERENGFRCVY